MDSFPLIWDLTPAYDIFFQNNMARVTGYYKIYMVSLGQ